MPHTVRVIGAGLAGSEAAWQLAQRGFTVKLFEMRPNTNSLAHTGSDCAELVCSNSLKSEELTTAAGLLKAELELLDSLLLRLAREHRVPAGAALAVERAAFAQTVTRQLEQHPRIHLIREEQTTVADIEQTPTIIAAGPLASDALASDLRQVIGRDALAFYDAAAPIVTSDSLDFSRVFAASRYGKGSGEDYLNCALDAEEYERFYQALIQAERVIKKDFERRELFAACQPIEEVARRGTDALRYGALKPVGIDDPRTGRYPWAVVQLRAENRPKTLYNLVGFQTNLTHPEQRRVFSLIPGLEQAEFTRLGVMHRNTFVDAPRVLNPDLSLKAAPHRLWLAGQISGTEGYLEAVGSGLICARSVAATLNNIPFTPLPPTTVLGALIAHATDPATGDYQPQHVNFGLMPALADAPRAKKDRYRAYGQRSMGDLKAWLSA